MIEDINISAAEVLGWTRLGGLFRVPDGHMEVLHCPLRVKIVSLKFSKSYDWAMLLAKKVKDTGYKFTLETYNTIDFWDKKQEVHRCRIWDELDQEELYSADSEGCFSCLPSLITETCLEFFKQIEESNE